MRSLFKLVTVVALVAAAYMAYGLLRPMNPGAQNFVLLRPGSSTRRIAHELKDHGVIASWPAFLALHYWKERPLKAGEYLFDRPANALQVYDRLARGDIYVHTVVIPEGYNIYDIAGAIQSAGLGSAGDFLKLARNDVTVVSDLDPAAKSLEGYLFPDTYRFTRTQDLQDIVLAMVHRFRQEAKQIGLSSDVHRVVTMASIVEKETGAPQERPLVASVYYNRMKKGMAFDADPTVIYAALLESRYRGSIYQSDLQSASPYNTYKYSGLPPGPIANPGRDALLAAMHPADSNYLYFVSDNNGHHRFATTLAEHNQNVVAYRRSTGAH
jgi:peptidoglycan lytic transglycosylase G